MTGFWRTAHYEFLGLWRLPSFAVPTLAYPVLVYVLVGLQTVGSARTTTAVAVFYCGFAVLGVLLFNFGVGFAAQRDTPWQRYLRTLPLPGAVHLVARLAVAVPFSGLAVLPVLGVAAATGRLHLGPGAALACLATLVVGSLPFGLLGVAIGYWVPAQGAAATTTLLYLPLAFVGGLFSGAEDLPRLVRTLGPASPTGMWRAALEHAVLGDAVGTRPVLGLLGYALVFGAVAALGIKRSEDREFR